MLFLPSLLLDSVSKLHAFALHVSHIVLTHEVLSDSLDLRKLEGKGVKDSLLALKLWRKLQLFGRANCHDNQLVEGSKFIVALAISGKVPADWSRVLIQ